MIYCLRGYTTKTLLCTCADPTSELTQCSIMDLYPNGSLPSLDSWRWSHWTTWSACRMKSTGFPLRSLTRSGGLPRQEFQLLFSNRPLPGIGQWMAYRSVSWDHEEQTAADMRTNNLFIFVKGTCFEPSRNPLLSVWKISPPTKLTWLAGKSPFFMGNTVHLELAVFLLSC